ncbi:MAG: hypothetical protein KKF48_01275 [Nanoarchaeota archaeon]|nr:hypothetical protein [Nanoarchaeota archaeon]MBU1027654.1 hypothetical protein [Nanoarchaeota archaeon]
MWVTILLSFLYAGTGIVATIGYFPTIKDLIRGKKSANISSYVIWTSCALIVFLYSLIVISDLLLAIVTGLNFLSCAVILFLAIRLELIKK